MRRTMTIVTVGLLMTCMSKNAAADPTDAADTKPSIGTAERLAPAPDLKYVDIPSAGDLTATSAARVGTASGARSTLSPHESELMALRASATAPTRAAAPESDPPGRAR